MDYAQSLQGYASGYMYLEFPTFKKAAIYLHDHFIPHARNNYHPHVLKPTMLGLVSLLVMSIKVSSLVLLTTAPATTVESAPITQVNVLKLANEARVAAGVAELKDSPLLSRAAQNKANDMLARQYFAHNTPDGQTPWTFIKAVGYSYVTAGENLAIDFTQVENVQAAWMNSPGHRANILNANFQELGVGIAKGMFEGHETTIVVQMFAAPMAQQVTMQPQPTPVQQPAAATPTPANAQPVQQPVAQQPVAQPTTNNSAPIAAPAQPNYQTVATQAAPEQSTSSPQNGMGTQIINTETSFVKQNFVVTVQTVPEVSRVVAFYGDKSTIFTPLDDNFWEARIPLSSLNEHTNVMVQSENLAGQIHQEPIANFSSELSRLDSQYGNVEGASITVFGKSFNPKIWEQKALMLVLAGLLAALILAIGIKRHVQHMSLVANTSFVGMLIAMLLMV